MEYVWKCGKGCGAITTLNYHATEADYQRICGGELAWSHNVEEAEEQ